MLAQLLRKFRHSNWPETIAEVQICKFDRYAQEENVGAEPPYYAVEVSYEVGGQTYDAGFMSPVEVQQGDTFPIRYNPAHPERNSAEPYGDWEKYYDVVLVLVVVGFILGFYLTHR